jgi:type II secretory pathway pseudopilin PulG
MKKNQYGFSAVEIVIVILIVGLLGLLGWYVWQKNNDKLPSTSSAQNSINSDFKTTEKTKNIDTNEVKGTKKIVTFGGYTYTYTFPENWKVEEKDYSEYGEYNVFIFEPSNQYRLTLKTFGASSGNSPETSQNDAPYKFSFLGVNNKTNYINNLAQSEPTLPPALHISACETYFCHNEFGPDKKDTKYEWSLGIYIDRVENITVPTSNTKPIDENDEAVKQQLSVIGTIEM